MLKINDEVEGHYRHDDLDPGRQHDDVQNAPATLPGNERQADRENRQQQTYHYSIDYHHGKVGKPASYFAVSQRTTGSNDFPDCNNRQYPEEKGKANDLFSGHVIYSHTADRQRIASRSAPPGSARKSLPLQRKNDTLKRSRTQSDMRSLLSESSPYHWRFRYRDGDASPAPGVVF